MARGMLACRFAADIASCVVAMPGGARHSESMVRKKEVFMSSPAPFEPIAQLLERSLSIRHVYGEPVNHGDTTVIPVAQVVYAFGAGGGQAPGRPRKIGIH